MAPSRCTLDGRAPPCTSRRTEDIRIHHNRLHQRPPGTLSRCEISSPGDLPEKFLNELSVKNEAAGAAEAVAAAEAMLGAGEDETEGEEGVGACGNGTLCSGSGQ